MPRTWNFEHEASVGLLCIVICILTAVTMTGSAVVGRAMEMTSRICALPEIPPVALMTRVDVLRRWTGERRKLLVELADLKIRNRELQIKVGEEICRRMKIETDGRNCFPVVFRDPRTWWEDMSIDTFGQHLTPGSPVYDGADLIGVVMSCDGSRAGVKLISSSAFYVPVVLSTTREIGVVTGDGAGGVWVKYLPSGSAFGPDTKLYTVLGSRLPAGLPVGSIIDEHRPIAPGVDEWRVKTGADLFRLQYVYCEVADK